ncbi:hypothetical protein HZC00_04680 [Candidatus Kaiserbacteria bacterium]|nr:hypothetical protein [Candidatus Kaiserbacteria bacterium]
MANPFFGLSIVVHLVIIGCNVATRHIVLTCKSIMYRRDILTRIGSIAISVSLLLVIIGMGGLILAASLSNKYASYRIIQDIVPAAHAYATPYVARDYGMTIRAFIAQYDAALTFTIVLIASTLLAMLVSSNDLLSSIFLRSRRRGDVFRTANPILAEE